MEYRHSKDIDLWVDPARVFDAIEVLRSDGYRCPLLDVKGKRANVRRLVTLAHHLCFEKPGAPQIELHSHLLLFTQLCNLSFADARTHAQLISVGGAEIPSLAPVHLLAYLCAHGSTHEWARLKWLADLPRILETLSWTWEDLLVPTAQRGASRVIAVAAALCAHVFEYPVPEHGYPPANMPVIPRGVLNVALTQMHRPNERTITGLPIGDILRLWRYFAALSPAVQHKLLVAAYFVRPKESDLQTLGLPDPLYPLYFVLRPFLSGWRRIQRRI
jgi:hypothetical protein